MWAKLYFPDNQDEITVWRLYDKKNQQWMSDYIDGERQVKSKITRALNHKQELIDTTKRYGGAGEQYEYMPDIDDIQVVTVKISRVELKRKSARAFYPRKYGNPLTTLANRLNDEDR